jgi:hypothetical protein
MASNIGIKIANGEFYPIIEENSLLKKRLILTTVHDNQPSVQIDLYRSTVGVMADAQYIGSLVVENIKQKSKGEPSIEMVISSNSRGEIIADAIDLDTSAGGEHYVLTVSLKSLDETSRDMEIPDFELESNEEPPTGLYQRAQKIRKEKKGSSKVWIFVLIGIILILGLLAAWLFLLGGMNVASSFIDRSVAVLNVRQEPAGPAKQPEPAPVEPIKQPEPAPVEPARQPEPAPIEPARQPEPVRESTPEPVRPSEPVQQVTQPVPVIQAPVTAPAPRQETTRQRPPPPVASYNVPAVIPREGVNYRIRWGDTLWDISEAFYRNPWLYTRIARHNNIRNPNLIISGRTIRIPPKN